MIPEFRVYYDAQGNIICYSCEKHDGDYIVITKEEYAESRPELRVVDGKLVRPRYAPSVINLVRSDEGISCATEDITIVTTEGNTQKWKLEVNEF